MMKISYIYSVERKMCVARLPGENFVSGLQYFTACPAREKNV